MFALCGGQTNLTTPPGDKDRDVVARLSLSAFGKGTWPREAVLDTWWVRMLAGALVALLLALLTGVLLLSCSATG
jgi:hypothetical protein